MDVNARIPRIVITAPKSGSGKTVFTCGLMRLLLRRDMKVAGFKCGPDYIDPMFHRSVLGVNTGNLDTFFTGTAGTARIFACESAGADIAVVEGVMGYYDGLGGEELTASTYDVARTIAAQALLVVDAKGASVTLAAMIAGIASFASDAGICGVVLNRVSPSYYTRIATVIEEQTGIPVLGYMRDMPELALPSRHLGLVQPEELSAWDKTLDTAADEIAANVDVDRLLALAEANEIDTIAKPGYETDLPILPSGYRIGVAKDEAFTFFYRENLELLARMGAELVCFSPLHDKKLPEETGALLFLGGYPELYARKLSENVSMREAVKSAVAGGCKCIAECGGFLYLGEELDGEDGETYPMVGLIKGRGYRPEKRGRFGYMTCGKLRGHEFHRYTHTNMGEDLTMLAQGRAERSYRAMHLRDGILAGFPHFYYESDPVAIHRFLTEGTI